MKEAQQLLYDWISMRGSVRYERIKEMCEYLNIHRSLELEKPIGAIFYPLLYSGVVDFSDIGRYRITPCCIVACTKKKRFIISNPPDTVGLSSTFYVGIYITTDVEKVNNIGEAYTFSASSILSLYPSVDKVVVDPNRKSSIPISELIFEGNKKVGLAKRGEESFSSYFVAPNNSTCYQVKHPSENPDAKNVAICYDRVVKGSNNGLYYKEKKRLLLRKRGIPILVYRVLLLNSLLLDCHPLVSNTYYEFMNVDKQIVKELNRILCNTIKIEK